MIDGIGTPNRDHTQDPDGASAEDHCVSVTLPPHIRPMSYALHELLFDLTYAAQAHLKVDLESVFILCCVNEATMRPLLLGGAPPEMLVAERPPDEFRGFISRRSIAERTSLSRETVRRKVKELVERGLVLVDERGRVRSVQSLGDPVVQEKLEEAHRTIERYHERLRAALGEDSKPR